jgi:hypothetical protein
MPGQVSKHSPQAVQISLILTFIINPVETIDIFGFVFFLDEFVGRQTSPKEIVTCGINL